MALPMSHMVSCFYDITFSAWMLPSSRLRSQFSPAHGVTDPALPVCVSPGSPVLSFSTYFNFILLFYF